MASTTEDTQILQLTLRSKFNAYQKGNGVQILDYSPRPNSAWYTFSQYLFGIIVIHYFLWFLPLLAWFFVPYGFGYKVISGILIGWYAATYFRTDELRLGRPWEWFRLHKFWKLLHHYMGLELVRETPLDPNRKYIFAHHPHGILILTRIASYGGVFEKLFPGIQFRVLGASPMFSLPGCREMCLWLGAIRADKSCAVNVLQQNLSLLLYPGGSDEIFETNKDSKETVIICRKGFIRLALEEGADIVPSFGFGEKHYYHKLNIPRAITAFVLRHFKMPLLIFWGRYFTLLPFQTEHGLSVVYGKPIRIEKSANPTDLEVDAVYETYYAEIKRLFEKYKARYGYSDEEVLIIKEAKSGSKVIQKADGNCNLVQNGHCQKKEK